jgi:alkylhydroperoxidase family enzyme
LIWYDLVKQGADPRHLSAVAGWREAPFFSERECAALRWAEIITATSHGDASPDGHPNSPTFGHLKFPHPEHGVTTG